MPSIADSATFDSLIERLRALTPESERRWGTMTPNEMLCHLGDANEESLITFAVPKKATRTPQTPRVPSADRRDLFGRTHPDLFTRSLTSNST